MYPDENNKNVNWESPATPPQQTTSTWNNINHTIPGFTPEASATVMKQKKVWPKVVALCLSCALLGGAAGVGGSMLANGTSSSGNSVLYESQRDTTSVSIVAADGQTELSLSDIYANYVNSCVGISAGSTTNIWGQEVSTASSGSGFVITSDGYILTNYHVIEGADTLTVTFADGTEYPATLVGGESDNDIAVLKIEATGLTPVVIGDSDESLVGETVCTIGNPLGELTFSLTDGVVSALNRTVTYSDGSALNMIQTNCTINAGNSGGPLFNTYGEVIGITSAKYSSSSYSTTSSSIEGLGFAIPINDVIDMVTDIMENGYVTGKPYLGISVYSVSSDAQAYGVPAGAYVESVNSGSCAETAGILAGDIITAVDDTTITSSAELTTAKNQYSAGDTATFTIYRDGQTLTVSVTFDEEQPETEDSSSSSSTTDGSTDSGSSSDSSGNYYFSTPWGNYQYGSSGNSGSYGGR